MARRVLVVANRTVAGRALLEAVRQRAQEQETEFHLVVPMTKPRHGNVIYDHSEREAAELRIQLAHDFLGQEGISITGEVGDEDPFTATLDAVAVFAPDEVIISTLPETRSGWLRKDLPERIREDTGLPVDHVVSDVDSEGLAIGVTLIIANRTSSGDELLETLKKQADEDSTRVFIAVIPQEGGEGKAAQVARNRLNNLLRRLRREGIMASGMIGDPDPADAAMNALELFTVDRVVVSTLPGQRSGWLRGGVVDRIRNGTRAEVEHIEVEMERAPA